MTDNIIDLEAPYGRKKDGAPRMPNGWQQRGKSIGISAGEAGGQFHGPGSGPGNHGPGPGRMKEGPAKQQFIADKKAASERMLAIMVEIAEDERVGDQVRLNAAIGAKNQIDGTPVQRIAATPHGETVEELRTVTIEFVKAKA